MHLSNAKFSMRLQYSRYFLGLKFDCGSKNLLKPIPYKTWKHLLKNYKTCLFGMQKRCVFANQGNQKYILKKSTITSLYIAHLA